jgi:hypothetical protein
MRCCASRFAISTAFSSAALLLAGCGSTFNTRNMVGEPRLSVRDADLSDTKSMLADRTVQLPAVGGNARNDAGKANEKQPGPQPAIGTNLSRAGWQRTTVLLPIDGIEGNPTYSRTLQWTDETSRQRNEFPTPMTALELDGDENTQLKESLLGGPYSLLQGALMPFRMATHRPWQAVSHSPQVGYRAAPTTSQKAAADLARLRELEKPLSDLTGPVGGPVDSNANQTPAPNQ